MIAIPFKSSSPFRLAQELRFCRDETWRRATVSTRSAGRNWSPSFPSAGLLPGEQNQSLHAITAQILQRIASSLARELKELAEKEEQEQMAAAIARLFHLDSPQEAPAGTRSEKQTNDQRTKRAVAINY
jgi:hypothetical protein